MPSFSLLVIGQLLFTYSSSFLQPPVNREFTPCSQLHTCSLSSYHSKSSTYLNCMTYHRLINEMYVGINEDPYNGYLWRKTRQWDGEKFPHPIENAPALNSVLPRSFGLHYQCPQQIYPSLADSACEQARVTTFSSQLKLD